MNETRQLKPDFNREYKIATSRASLTTRSPCHKPCYAVKNITVKILGLHHWCHCGTKLARGQKVPSLMTLQKFLAEPCKLAVSRTLRQALASELREKLPIAIPVEKQRFMILEHAFDIFGADCKTWLGPLQTYSCFQKLEAGNRESGLTPSAGPANEFPFSELSNNLLTCKSYISNGHASRVEVVQCSNLYAFSGSLACYNEHLLEGAFTRMLKTAPNLTCKLKTIRKTRHMFHCLGSDPFLPRLPDNCIPRC